ncbi:hypothetical protein WMY93_023020 [Mugilogobius chulae]|uniref:Uncharacterized protein n=1 Tax=Mugilogobius chulae TaxID=88201 RepID=A0AAW0N7L4_9GOBI
MRRAAQVEFWCGPLSWRNFSSMDYRQRFDKWTTLPQHEEDSAKRIEPEIFVLRTIALPTQPPIQSDRDSSEGEPQLTADLDSQTQTEGSAEAVVVDLVYALNDRPPWYLCILLGFQVKNNIHTQQPTRETRLVKCVVVWDKRTTSERKIQVRLPPRTVLTTIVTFILALIVSSNNLVLVITMRVFSVSLLLDTESMCSVCLSVRFKACELRFSAVAEERASTASRQSCHCPSANPATVWSGSFTLTLDSALGVIGRRYNADHCEAFEDTD